MDFVSDRVFLGPGSTLCNEWEPSETSLPAASSSRWTSWSISGEAVTEQEVFTGKTKPLCCAHHFPPLRRNEGENEWCMTNVLSHDAPQEGVQIWWWRQHKNQYAAGQKCVWSYALPLPAPLPTDWRRRCWTLLSPEVQLECCDSDSLEMSVSFHSLGLGKVNCSSHITLFFLFYGSFQGPWPKRELGVTPSVSVISNGKYNQDRREKGFWGIFISKQNGSAI